MDRSFQLIREPILFPFTSQFLLRPTTLKDGPVENGGSLANYGKVAQKSVKMERRHRKTGKHGGMGCKQAVAIGLSKAQRKGAKGTGRSRGTKKEPCSA
ncbi:MAG TPA: DUF6496 domain-containing protein [Candidatus Thermoplasmatota archaeon]